MPKAHQDPKSTSLDSDGLLNPHPGAVTDTLFQTNAFFDARDLMQVKYEMLRRSMVEGESKADAALAFGLSRPTFYQVERAFAEHGLAGLLPRKRGPKEAHKLSAKVMAYLEQLLAKDASLRAPALVTQLAQRFGVQVHPRSIERALARKKKRRSLAPVRLSPQAVQTYEALRSQALAGQGAGGGWLLLVRYGICQGLSRLERDAAATDSALAVVTSPDLAPDVAFGVGAAPPCTHSVPTELIHAMVAMVLNLTPKEPLHGH